jgi:GGDEF domain-containing protein
VLRLAADTARKTIRASDAVARLGGDEFAILLHETTAAASEIGFAAPPVSRERRLMA